MYTSCNNTCTYFSYPEHTVYDEYLEHTVPDEYPEHTVYDEVAASNVPVHKNIDSLDILNLAGQIQDRFTPEQVSELQQMLAHLYGNHVNETKLHTYINLGECYEIILYSV